MADHIPVPIKVVNKERWGYLGTWCERHEFIAEKIDIKNQQFSFAGQHRLRLCVAKKSVHWKIPSEYKPQAVDISGVPPAAAAPRRIQRK
jgi:hypothetical protein